MWEIVAIVIGVVFARAVLPTIVDAMFIPVAVGVIAAARKRLGIYRLM